MKLVNKAAILIFVMLLVLGSNSYSQSGVSLDHVDHLRGGAVAVDIPTSFKIRFNNDYSGDIHGFSFAFRFYLSNNTELSTGAFAPITYSYINSNDWISGFTLLPVLTEEFSVDGFAADTVGIRGVESFLAPPSNGSPLLPGGGLPIGYDDIVFELTTSAVLAHVGDSLCIDSSIFLPANQWHWHLQGNIRFEDVPWTGPHCYEIVENCCIGIRGNVDVSSNEAIDISDIVLLVNFMFVGGDPLLCDAEADFDGSGGVDISDLVGMVAYMFQSGASPALCLL